MMVSSSHASRGDKHTNAELLYNMMGDIVKLVQDAAGAERRECSILAGEGGVGSGERETHFRREDDTCAEC